MFKKIYVGFLTAILIIAPIFLFAQNGDSQGATKNKTLAFSWDQAAADTSSGQMGGWNIYRSATAGGPYTLAAAVPFTVANPSNTYTTDTVITVPANSETRLYFVATAFDTAGNETAFSNEISVLLDFAPPAVPINFKVTVTTGP